MFKKDKWDRHWHINIWVECVNNISMYTTTIKSVICFNTDHNYCYITLIFLGHLYLCILLQIYFDIGIWHEYYKIVFVFTDFMYVLLGSWLILSQVIHPCINSFIHSFNLTPLFSQSYSLTHGYSSYPTHFRPLIHLFIHRTHLQIWFI